MDLTALLQMTEEDQRAHLASLSPEVLQETLDAAVEQFDALVDAESDDFDTMTQLANLSTNCHADQDRREAEAAEGAERRRTLAEQVHGPGEQPDEGDEGEGEGDDGDGASAETPAPEAVPASAAPATPPAAAPPAPRRPSAAATRARTTRPVVPDRHESPIVITAAADVPNFPLGGRMNGREDIARALHGRSRGLADGGNRALVASIEVPVPEANWIEGNPSQAVLDQWEQATLTPERSAQGLVAAGGWCTPSETLYDLFRVDGATGLLDLPTIGTRRGGVNVPSFFTQADVQGAFWTWTEAMDVNITATITNKALTSNVATLTTSTTHSFRVGQTVLVAIGDPVFDGKYVITSVPTGTTFTYARTNANVTSAAATGTATGQKGCLRIPCPTWTDNRLEAEGLCVTHGNLTDQSFPELTTAFVDIVMNAHLHRMSSLKIAKIVASVTAPAAVTIATGPSSATSEILSAISLQAEDYRSQYKMSDATTLEVAAPSWLPAAMQSDLAMRHGDADFLRVSRAEITAMAAVRSNVRVQWLEDYQALYASTPKTAWPTSAKFLMWAAGAYAEATGPTIDLGVQRDSVLNATNDHTVAWSEQTYQVVQRGPDAREVTVTILVDGVTAVGP